MWTCKVFSTAAKGRARQGKETQRGRTNRCMVVVATRGMLNYYLFSMKTGIEQCVGSFLFICSENGAVARKVWI